MAIPTGLGGIRIGRIFNDAFMGCLPIGIIWVAAMAVNACYLSVVLILQDFAVNKNLFVRGQRLHITASPLPFWFSTLESRPGLSNLPGDFCQFLGTGVAFEALALLGCLAYEKIARNKNQAKGNDQTNHFPIFHNQKTPTFMFKKKPSL
ncbi:MAG: hypothetical protein AMK74_00525 [Nitrospira bacterium SM23_35]|nr:MAG: hypothetical protein AMK74_00525 [Nitrospira bacterium SM23_35]